MKFFNYAIEKFTEYMCFKFHQTPQVVLEELQHKNLL